MPKVSAKPGQGHCYEVVFSSHLSLNPERAQSPAVIQRTAPEMVRVLALHEPPTLARHANSPKRHHTETAIRYPFHLQAQNVQREALAYCRLPLLSKR